MNDSLVIMTKEDKLLKEYIKYFGDKPPLPPRHIMESLVKMKEEGKEIDDKMGSGHGTLHSIRFKFKSGDYVEVVCYDYYDEYTDKTGIVDSLRVGIVRKELDEWIRYKAY